MRYKIVKVGSLFESVALRTGVYFDACHLPSL